MKKILATGAMLAYITFFNSTGALATNVPEIAVTDIQGTKSYQSARHDKYSEARTERQLNKTKHKVTNKRTR